MELPWPMPGHRGIALVWRTPRENEEINDSGVGYSMPQETPTSVCGMISINGEVVAKVLTGSGIATDPLFGWRIAGVQRGDTVTVAWRDNLGNTRSKDTRAQ